MTIDDQDIPSECVTCGVSVPSPDVVFCTTCEAAHAERLRQMAKTSYERRESQRKRWKKGKAWVDARDRKRRL